MKHILSAGQFKPSELEAIFKRADYMHQHSATLAGRRRLANSHNGYVMATMFYEPSTRTRLSFESAALRLGIGVISTENAAEFSSAVKGETIEDTTRVIASYADAMVIRHKENGAADRAASVSTVPIINAGDGTGEHPTQALLDLYTIRHELGRLKDLKIVVIGDLKYGRTARSLVRLLAPYPNNHITFVAPAEMQIGDDIKQYLKQRKVAYKETDEMHQALAAADVVYQTRVQTERHETAGKTDGNGQDKKFIIGKKELGMLKKDAIIMHPLPRINEIETVVDSDPRAAYFRQVQNGLYVRMALLDILFS